MSLSALVVLALLVSALGHGAAGFVVDTGEMPAVGRGPREYVIPTQWLCDLVDTALVGSIPYDGHHRQLLLDELVAAVTQLRPEVILGLRSVWDDCRHCRSGEACIAVRCRSRWHTRAHVHRPPHYTPPTSPLCPATMHFNWTFREMRARWRPVVDVVLMADEPDWEGGSFPPLAE